MKVSCPALLGKMTGNPSLDDSDDSDRRVVSEDRIGQPRRRRQPRKHSLGWSYIDQRRSSVDEDKFDDNENGANGRDAIDYSEDISNIYSKLHELETRQKGVDHGADATDLYAKLHELELELTEIGNSGTARTNDDGNHDALYRAQNELRANLSVVEQKMDDLRFVIQMQKCTTEMISDSIKCLHDRTVQMEDELSQNSRSAHII